MMYYFTHITLKSSLIESPHIYGLKENRLQLYWNKVKYGHARMIVPLVRRFMRLIRNLNN
jgi:hypothetical protein